MSLIRKFKPYVAEGTAIVVSILLAFGIDAAWSDYQSGREESKQLNALRSELLSNRQNIQDQIRWHQDVDGAIADLLELASGDASTTADSLDVLLGMASWFNPSTTFERAVLDALVQGGELHIIESAEIKRGLTAWNQAVDRAVRIERQDYDTFYGVWMPYLREKSYLPQISNTIDVQPGGDPNYGVDVAAVSSSFDHGVLLSDREFANVLLHRKWVQVDIFAAYDMLLPKLDLLVNVIDRELQ